MAVLFCAVARAQNPNITGITLLQVTTTHLNGAGIRVAQAEAAYPTFEVDPAAVNQPISLFTYISDAGTSSAYPNSVGTNFWHAGYVGGIFYGLPGGVATNVSHVDNYDAGYFYSGTILAASSTNSTDRVVNQSFVFSSNDYSHLPLSQEESIDSAYDNYAAQYNMLFVSGAGNGPPYFQTPVYPPATCYNGLGVAAYGGGSCTGPTLDYGRCKPDITAPAAETSYSTPQVAGAAAILFQAGLRGDGGSDTNSAGNIRTVKALLLNGAVKPANWTNSASSPLDFRYGAGVFNVFNSYEQLAGGKHGYIVSTTVSPIGGPHPPTGATGTIGVLSGWDFNTNSSGKSASPQSQFDAVNHYYFNITNNMPGADFTATATLVWERQKGKTAINNLELFLYNCANSNLVTCSTSLVDNVQHIFVLQLAQGRYDLQVWKAGGSGIVSSAEPYALAYAFTQATLNFAYDGTNAKLTWPAYPAGFRVEATTNLTAPAWSTNNLPAVLFATGTNRLVLGTTNSQQYFRLRQPNF